MSFVAFEKPSPFALDGLGGRRHCGGAAAFSAGAAAVEVAGPESWLSPPEKAAQKNDGEFDIWASVQTPAKAAAGLPAPYVHPLVRLSANSLSQRSLEMCTESLGSETGSDGMISSEDLDDYFSTWTNSVDDDFVEKSNETGDVESELGDEEETVELPPSRRKPTPVNYHCSSGRSPARFFPPPLPSICRRDGPCLSMRRHRLDGRLVVEAVTVPSQNYLHAQRHNGRLLLTFIDTATEDIYPGRQQPAAALEQLRCREEEDAYNEAEAEVEARAPEETDEEEIVVEEEDEEVELVDRGIVVEVKVSRPQLPQSGGLKVQLSSVVINKFVGVPLTDENPWVGKLGRAAQEAEKEAASTTTTATAVVAAAAAASSSLSADERYWRNGKGPLSALRHPSPEKLHFTSKGQMNRGDLLHQVRRCSEHHRPLFIWEPCCVASS
ncbi:unnamed protein product [Spirodela intermedia]|uniref:FAF domain-containing protein n=1 Tax=Spirodela intermedia TaxID=51605 RepID=A0A7I8LDE2_SPIIN|nr:unnamed protein product [Spirodela intermedia]